MQTMVDVVVDINTLVAKYGSAVVKHALHYIDTFPVVSKQYKFSSGAYDWYLSQDEFQRVNREYNNGTGKIQAIKTFREITTCGLKEAKDAIEDYYNCRYSSTW